MSLFLIFYIRIQGDTKILNGLFQAKMPLQIQNLKNRLLVFYEYFVIQIVNKGVSEILNI